MSREQAWGLSLSLEEQVPPDNPASFVAEFVGALVQKGWAEPDVHMEGEPLGAPADHLNPALQILHV